MELFGPILNQMIFLFTFIVLGFILTKGKFIPEESAKVLSKLENLIFIPALVMGTFIENCTVKTLSSVWRILLMGVALLAVLIPLSLLAARLCFKEEYLKKVTTYGLAFSNFAYMGNAVVAAVFPDIFFEYTIFCLPFWVLIYLWGVPVLLVSDNGKENGKGSFMQRLKAFLNPMLICMLIGMVLGLTGLGTMLPSAIVSVVKTSGNCMSPVAMLLTGMTVAKIDILALLKQWRIYAVTAVKLVFFPLLFIGVFAFIPQGVWISRTFLVCGLAVSAMPAGLNTIVIPAGYGKDTTFASGLALVTHIFSVITIPLAFMLFQTVVL